MCSLMVPVCMGGGGAHTREKICQGTAITARLLIYTVVNASWQNYYLQKKTLFRKVNLAKGSNWHGKILIL